MRIRRRKRKFGFSISILWVCSGEKKLPWRRQEEKRENQSEKLLIRSCWIWELKVRFLCVNFGEMEMEMELQGLEEKTETRDESEKWLSLSHTYSRRGCVISHHIISCSTATGEGGKSGLGFHLIYENGIFFGLVMRRYFYLLWLDHDCFTLLVDKGCQVDDTTRHDTLTRLTPPVQYSYPNLSLSLC